MKETMVTETIHIPLHFIFSQAPKKLVSTIGSNDIFVWLPKKKAQLLCLCSNRWDSQFSEIQFETFNMSIS